MLQALRFTFIMFLISGIGYPLLMTGLGQALFPAQATGSLITNSQGVTIGSSLIGQNFTRPEYFHPRPSVNSYDAANSGGSNYGPTQQKLVDRIHADTQAYRTENALQGAEPLSAVPMDAVTTSASGLDPDISIRNALNQVARVAAAHHLNTNKLRQLVLSHQAPRLFTEQPYVNVLQLNIALDQLVEKT